MAKPEPTFEEWVTTLPTLMTSDPVWSVKAYRLALYAADIGWGDVTCLLSDDRTKSLSDQLYRALGSISANIEEGYSRGSEKDRTRFYEYALGSARESRGWYYKGRHVLGEDVMLARMSTLSQVIRLLLTMSGSQRGYRVHEGEEPYAFDDASTTIG